jgi:hypothetical protein
VDEEKTRNSKLQDCEMEWQLICEAELSIQHIGRHLLISTEPFGRTWPNHIRVVAEATTLDEYDPDGHLILSARLDEHGPATYAWLLG